MNKKELYLRKLIKEETKKVLKESDLPHNWTNPNWDKDVRDIGKMDKNTLLVFELTDHIKSKLEDASYILSNDIEKIDLEKNKYVRFVQDMKELNDILTHFIKKYS